MHARLNNAGLVLIFVMGPGCFTKNEKYSECGSGSESLRFWIVTSCSVSRSLSPVETEAFQIRNCRGHSTKDGICCGEGFGNYEISVDGIVKKKGGRFQRRETTIWRL